MSKRQYEARLEMRTVLERLDKRWIQAASHDLCERLTEIVDLKLDRPVNHVLAWSSFFPGEVNLASFIESQIGKREVYLPRVLPDRKMTFIAVQKDWMHGAEPGAFGVLGPQDSETRRYDPQWCDDTVIIVPGLAFDQEGGRLGRGQGYYNTFLRPPMTRAIKIGVCWSLQLLSTVPSDADHAILDWIVHERGAINTGLRDEDDVL